MTNLQSFILSRCSFLDSSAKKDYNRRMEFLGQNVNIKRGRKRGISLTVKDGKIYVTAHLSVTDAQIFEFLSHHKRFVQKRLDESELRNKNFADVLDFSHVLIVGTKYPLVLGTKRGIEQKTVYARMKSEVPIIIENAYRESFKNRVKRYAEYVGVTYSSIEFGIGKSKWGSCDTNGRLFFSRSLFMLPLPLVDYVIVHELCHRRHMNHSERFWKEVEKYLPDYLTRRQELKHYNFLTRVYS